MGTRNARPFRWSPSTVCDSLDSTNNSKGSMANLANLIPDPTTRNLWQCRPAAFSLTTFSGFNTPGFVSALKIIGSFVVGMVATARNAGKDEPFVYNLATAAFVSVTGVTSANVPTSPATTGAWTAPTVAFIGTWAIITHPGFNGSGNGYYGGINLSNPAAPAYQSGNLATNPLASVPVFVAQYNGRAWFGLNPPTGQPSIAYSNSLDPWTQTNAGAALFLGDNNPLLNAAGVPLNNVLGGVIQSLFVFKANSIYQITGDTTTSNLAQNQLPNEVGTIFASSLSETPRGVAFLAGDGIRFVDITGRVTDPVGFAGDGIVVPLIKAQVVSRVVTACNGSVVRIAFQNSIISGNPKQEYWYDLVRNIWSGPHTISSSLIDTYQGTFICTIDGTATLYQSDSMQSSGSTFIEAGTQLTWTWQTSMLPDDGQMNEKWIFQTTLNLGSIAGSETVNASAVDENGNSYDAATITLTGNSALWGTAIWGSFTWGGTTLGLRPYKVSWDQPIVFRRISFIFAGQSGLSLRVGDLFTQMGELGYLQQQS